MKKNTCFVCVNIVDFFCSSKCNINFKNEMRSVIYYCRWLVFPMCSSKLMKRIQIMLKCCESSRGKYAIVNIRLNILKMLWISQTHWTTSDFFFLFPLSNNKHFFEPLITLKSVSCLFRLFCNVFVNCFLQRDHNYLLSLNFIAIKTSDNVFCF